MKHTPCLFVTLGFHTLGFLAACNARPSPSVGAIGFDHADNRGWNAGSTGGTGPRATWTVHADEAAISPPNVLSLTDVKHEAEERFNVYWTTTLSFQDGRIGVVVRADGGKIDQGGGPMWRVQNENNYYLCRYNPLESNFRVYVVQDGVRRQLATALVEAGPGWHRLEAEHVGEQITCWLDGKQLLTATDASLSASGGVGLWTKADARTSFDDLVVVPRGN